MSNNISANKNLRIAARYVHTGNSRADFEIYRNDVRSDGAHFVLKIGAMGFINSEIEVVGDEFGGFTSDQLRDLANMFLYAADQLEKPATEQTFQGRSKI